MSRNPRSKPPEAKPFNIITTIKSSMDLQTYLEERPQLNLSLMLDAQNSTLIHFAVYHNDMPKLKLYLSHFDAFLRSSHGQTQFQITVQSQLKSWINKVNNEGNTAIHYAALSGNNEMIELLFRKGANIHFVNKNCENILFMCVQANQLKTLIWLINSEHKFRLEETNILGENILHEAARSGFLHLTEYLLTVSINPLGQNTRGETALMLAVRSGAKQIVKKMLLKGIDRHIRNQEGQDAIAIARSLQKEDLVKILNDQHSLQDSIKIACNRKITYQKEEPSLVKPFFFMVLFNLLFLPIAYLAEIVPARTLSFLPFVALGIYYASTMVLFVLLMIKHPKRERVDLTDLELPICPECSNSKPSQAFHCFICATCIHRYDHHCPWINNCVGTKNIGKFTAFLALTIIGCLYSIFGHVCLYFNILTNLVVLRDNPIPQIAIIQAVNIATTLLCGFFGFCIGMLLYEQLGNLCSNTTAYERSRKKQKRDRERERIVGQDSVETFNDLHKQSSLLSEINNDPEEEEQSCNCFGNCCRMLSQKAV